MAPIATSFGFSSFSGCGCRPQDMLGIEEKAEQFHDAEKEDAYREHVVPLSARAFIRFTGTGSNMIMVGGADLTQWLFNDALSSSSIQTHGGGDGDDDASHSPLDLASSQPHCDVATHEPIRECAFREVGQAFEDSVPRRLFIL
mmetsp:Transcript_108173/g.170544  ORF Transcript_108173/g.170544 Transcript_108173/m.170544 type:complete len:144 (-) Transcript_108173:253-684(-)